MDTILLLLLLLLLLTVGFFCFCFFFSELCWGKAMVAYTMPQQRKKKERSERLREERDQIKFIDLGFFLKDDKL